MSTLSLVRRDGISRQRDGRRTGRHVAVESRLKALNARLLGGNTGIGSPPWYSSDVSAYTRQRIRDSRCIKYVVTSVAQSRERAPHEYARMRVYACEAHEAIKIFE